MKWVKERDLLIAQTVAFVQSVTGKRPDLTATPISSVKFSYENKVAVTLSAPASTSIEVHATADAPVVTAPIVLQPTESQSSSADALWVEATPELLPVKRLSKTDVSSVARAIEPPQARLFAQGDVRMEIQGRVAAFQANQRRFQREREDYCKRVLTKVRSAIETGHDSTPQA